MILCDGIPIRFERWAGGELKFALPKKLNSWQDTVAYMRNTDDIILLPLVIDACLRNLGKPPAKIRIPYLPYARQDRPCADGEFDGASVMVRTLKSWPGLNWVVFDVHNPNHFEIAKMIEDGKITNVKALDLIRHSEKMHLYLKVQKPIIVAPDEGAWDRAAEVARQYNLALVRCEKTRDKKTGHPTITADWNLDLQSAHFLIVDDICDGGRTFLETARVLRTKYPLMNVVVNLYITHGIMSNPELLNGEIYRRKEIGQDCVLNHIWHTNSLGQDVTKDPTHMFMMSRNNQGRYEYVY